MLYIDISFYVQTDQELDSGYIMDTAPTPKKTPKTRLNRQARSEQLLNIAEALFLKGGYDGTTLEDVVREAGVTRPVVYDHFGSKEKLFIAVVARARSQYEDILLKAILSAPNTEALTLLKCGARVFFKFLEDDPKRWHMLFASTNISGEELAQELINIRHKTLQKTTKMIQIAYPKADEYIAGAFAYAISGAGEMLGIWWIANPHIKREQVEDIYCKFMNSGAGLMDTDNE